MRLISSRNLPAIVSCLQGWGLISDRGEREKKVLFPDGIPGTETRGRGGMKLKSS